MSYALVIVSFSLLFLYHKHIVFVSYIDTKDKYVAVKNV